MDGNSISDVAGTGGFCDGASAVENQSDGMDKVIHLNEWEKTPQNTDAFVSRQVYRYDARGNITGILDGEGNQTSYEMDEWGRITAIQKPDGSRESFAYDYAGNVAETTDGNGGTIAYEYNSFGKLGSITDQAGEKEAFSYNKQARVAGHIDRDGRETRYGYDALQRVSKVQYPDGNWEEFAYDRAGNRTERLTGSWKETYKYDVRNRLRKRTGTEVLSQDGCMIGLIPVETAQPFGSSNGLGDTKDKTMSSVTTLYSYDHQGNTLAEEMWKATSEFAKENGSVQSAGRPEGLIKKTSYEYNGFLKTSKISVCDVEMTNTLVTGNDVPKNVHVQENLYDAENFRYGIMEDGERTDFVSNGWDVYTELSDGDKIKNRLVRGYGIVAAEQETWSESDSGGLAYFYYHADEHNDVSYITGEDGFVKNQYEYDVFGGQTRADEIIRNRYKYNGEQYDEVTEQYYLRARFYNPVVARFTQEDIYRGDGLNLYAYCGNNAVVYEDPSGYKSKCQKGRLPRKNGKWEGDPGESSWYSNKKAVKNVTGGEGVPFKDGRPDFSKWSKGSLEFKKGVLNGTRQDFDAVYEKLMQDSKGKLKTKNAAKKWLKKKGLTPHHYSTTTIQFIPTDLHGNVPHIGSASDMRGGK